MSSIQENEGKEMLKEKRKAEIRMNKNGEPKLEK